VGIQSARAGIYPKSIEQDVATPRLREFFTESNGGYCVSKSIRDMCVFAPHDALSEPPFSRIDLVVCRNLLIYLEPVLQRKLLPTLHYALNPRGFLWLGSSESAGNFEQLFEAVDTRHRIYRR
jgi:two-component system CheB/CheR fusion protein